FVSSFKRAEELATAMECRCYRGDKNRTKLVKLTYRFRDLAWLLIVTIFMGAIISLRVLPSFVDINSTALKVLLYTI
ncbi:MAG: hypothetical protein IKV16_04965, partial [Clostridia bacterium]|nr:hypothetical protein [Clostridia bacterium]